MTEEELRSALQTLEALVKNPVLLDRLTHEERVAFLIAAGRVSRPTRNELTKLNRRRRIDRKQMILKHDRAVRATADIRVARQAAVYLPPPKTEAPSEPAPELKTPRHCYVCKTPFTRLHFFYDSMCQSCAELNYSKRFQRADLRGRTALITGARLKIGYQASLLLLRSGADVVATTRFPKDAAERYAAEPDYSQFCGRLRVEGLDLRHTPTVERFCRQLDSELGRLDILINNAAQTVRRPPAFYAHLLEKEGKPISALALQGDMALFPQGKLDADLQQVDLRTTNSWRMTLAEVPTAEMLETHLINAVAPFVLCARLKPLMLRTPGPKHVVNVSAMEGSFSRRTKTDKHPHTNMAKAALNMLTLTSAPDYAKDSIYMNAVDTGWVTDEDPVVHATRKVEEHDFQPPLDIVDGAARVLDPVLSSYNGSEPLYGKFLKDYKETAW
jgi:NAD(P)-dependent dehydrogenase (short-subunit alcohol dehydrogenase family)